MAQDTLSQVLQQIEALDTDELRVVGQVVQERLADRREVAAAEVHRRKRFHEILLATGLVREIKPPAGVDSPQPPLVSVRGKAVSETILEDRP